MLKIRQSRDRLIFNIGIPITGKDGLYIEAGPWTIQNFSVDIKGIVNFCHPTMHQISVSTHKNHANVTKYVQFEDALEFDCCH